MPSWRRFLPTRGAKPTIKEVASKSLPGAISSPAGGQKLDEANLAVLTVARRYIGVRELGGPNRGPEVEMFQRAVDGKAEAEPWCAAFVMFCVGAAETLCGIRSGVARSEHVLTIWRKSPASLRVRDPRPGDLMLWQVPRTERGHMGVVDGVNAEGHVVTVEGNTNQMGSREGDGVYVKVRSRTGSDKFLVLGWLRAFA